MGILAETFRSSLVTYLRAHDPTRVLIGGLPDFLLEGIAAQWDSQYHLLLVSDGGPNALPPNVKRCNADDLTAERQHGWAALVSADQSRGIQESIRSAGAGTVRPLWSSGFPWRPCQLPGVRWRDVRDEFIKRLGLSGTQREVADCIDRFRDELSGEVDASLRFFRALDAFQSNNVTYADICFQIGFPAHVAGRTLRKDKKDRESVLVLLDEFVERFKDDGVDEALAQFRFVAQAHYLPDPPKRAAVEGAVQFFADEFRHLQPGDAENPVRAWRSVFEKSRTNWDTLTADDLANLLGPSHQKLSFECSIKAGKGFQLFSIGGNQILSRDRNIGAAASVIASFQFGQALIQEASTAAATGTPWKLFARINRTPFQLTSALPGGAGPHDVNVRLENEGKQATRFYIGPSSSADRISSGPITLWECCQDYPLIVATSQAPVRAGKRKRSKDESGNTRYEVSQHIVLPSQGRVVLHGFICGLQGQLDVVRPGESSRQSISALTQIPDSLCRQFVLSVDAVEGTDITFTWPDAHGIYHRAIITFDFKGDMGPREDSTTGVLLRAHGGRGAKQLKQQLGVIKSGESLPPSELLVKETVKPIKEWELHQQNIQSGWWPMLISSANEFHGQLPITPNEEIYLFKSPTLNLNEQANAWRNELEPATTIGAPPPEMSNYATARAAVLEALGHQFQLADGESVDEVNLARKGVIGMLDQGVLSEYLRAAVTLLHAAKQPEFPNTWRWRAWCVDSALLFTSNAMAPIAQLIGPYHPITLARLFFIQQCLGERLLEDDISALAHVLVQAQPLALGAVVDGQLQPAHAISFPTGDPHWLWLYRQQSQSGLPEASLVEWLRRAGLDPQTGPLGVDAEILPQTLKQYILAYPSRQTLRLSLDDCSQRTFEVLRDELLREEGQSTDDDRLRIKVPGGLSVYDTVAKIERGADGERLSYEPDLPLRWHHGPPLGQEPIDLATLPRSHRVDFQSKARGGSHSSSAPTARRGTVEFTTSGLEVASALDAPAVIADLTTATVALLNIFEPSNQQVSWGTSLDISGSPRANWTLCSAGQVDPRLFIEYVRHNPGTALWTYRLFSLDDANTLEFGRGHFLIARVSQSLSAGLKAQLDGTGLIVAPEALLRELSEAGLTLGDEFLRTGRTAEGALGQYLIQRLVWQPAGSEAVLPHWTVSAEGVVQSAGFLLQVDPFHSVLETLAGRFQSGDGDDVASQQRSDLVSLHLQVCDDQLWIRPVVLESKYLKVGQPDIENALAQAGATATQFDHLLEYCLHDNSKGRGAFWAQPERLLLAELVHLGLRLSRGSFNGDADQWNKFERFVLSKTLSGDFRRDNSQAVVIVHHGGKSINNLASKQPHALVSFQDANSALTTTASGVYLEIQQTLATMIRHLCGDQPSPAVLPPLTPAAAVKLPDSPASPTAIEHLPEPAPVQSVSPGPIGPIEDQRPAPLEALTQAHAAFDAAFFDFIGNRQAIEKLRDDLVDALIKRPPHLVNAYLFTGNPSTGKTTLANKIAALLDVTFVKLVGTNIRTDADVVAQADNAFEASGKRPKITAVGSQGLPEHEYPECLIFIDEIHLVKGRAQESLLTLTEPKDRYIRLRDRICKFPRATYIAATTRDSEIDRALRTRFGNPIHLNDYKVEEVSEMLAVKKPVWAEWPSEIRLGIARLSRCIPREAERLAQKLERKMTVSLESLTLEGALEKLRLEEGLDRNGLDRVGWDLLRLLARQTRPLGRETLANQLGRADEDKLVSEIIPSLQALGLIEQVAGGQRISDRGRNYLRNEPPPA
jgi:Holliday junction resolvasome RuvABC ATP-dependent DNA helicase subunit